jgi:hypothetical protein
MHRAAGWTISQESILENNHELLPTINMPFCDELTRTPRDLPACDWSGSQLQEVTAIGIGCSILRFELDRLTANERNDAAVQGGPKTEILIQAMTEEGRLKGDTDWLKAGTEAESHRAAASAITDHEKDNIAAFRNVLFNDSTFIRDDLGWVTIAITLGTSNHSLPGKSKKFIIGY